MVLNRLITFTLCLLVAHALWPERQRLDGERVWRKALAN